MSEEKVDISQESKENVEGAPQVENKPKVNPEKDEEAKLRARYPGLKGPGSNALLHKRLSKGQKYFDSGDYNMARAKMGGGAASKPIAPTQKLVLRGTTGEAIPTPDTIPHTKSSMVQSKLAEGLS